MGLLARSIQSFNQVQGEAKTDPILRACLKAFAAYPVYLAAGRVCGVHYQKYLERRRKRIQREDACSAHLTLSIDKEAAEKDDWQRGLIIAIAEALTVPETRLSIQGVREARGKTSIEVKLIKSLDSTPDKGNNDSVPCNVLWARLKLGSVDSGPLADVSKILVDGEKGTEDDGSKVYSLWLMPSDKQKEACAKVIKTLGDEVGGASFEPHVTLLRYVAGQEEDIKTIAENFAQEAGKIPISFSGFSQKDKGEGSVYLEVNSSDDLSAAHMKLCKLIPKQRLPLVSKYLFGGTSCKWLDASAAAKGFFPHLTLVYNEKTSPPSQEQISTAHSSLLEEAAFTATEIVVWETDPEDYTCKSWKEVSRCKLAGKPRPGFVFLLKRFARVAAPEFAQIAVGTAISFATSMICDKACQHDTDLASGVHGGKSTKELFQVLFKGLMLWGSVNQGFTLSHAIIENAGKKIGGRLREGLFDNLMKQDVKWISQKGAEELHKTLLQRTDKIETMFTREIPGLVKMVTDFAINIGLLWLKRPRLCVFGFGIFAFQNTNSGIWDTIHSVAQDHDAKQEEVQANVLEVLQNFRVVRAFVREEKEKEAYRKTLWASLHIKRSDIVERFTGLGSWFGYEFSFQLAYLYGGMLVNLGQILPAEVKDVVSKAFKSMYPLYQLQWRLSRKSTFAEDAAAVLEALERRPDIPYEDDTKYNPKVHEVRGEIEAESMSFSYADDEKASLDKAALKEVSFKIRAGSMVGLVGPSGCGKSTMFNLILRFYDAQAGALKIDGVDLSQWNPQALYRAVAWVSQDQAVFAGSVLDNIRYGVPEASEADVLRVMKEAALYDDVIKKEKGVLTPASELSGGQKQRLSIARALLRDPKILLLDEATSALDTASERQVQKAFEGLMRGRTVIAIAHRLSTIMNSDLILVMEAGKVIEQGTHAELLKKSGGKYADLVQQQLAVDDDKANAETATDPEVVKDASFKLKSLRELVPEDVREEIEKAANALRSAADTLQVEKRRLTIREQSLTNKRKPWKAAKTLVSAMTAVRRMRMLSGQDPQEDGAGPSPQPITLERALSNASRLSGEGQEDGNASQPITVERALSNASRLASLDQDSSEVDAPPPITELERAETAPA